MSDTTATTSGEGHRLGGQRFVLTLYLVLTAVAGLIGVLFTVVVDDPSPPALFFFFELPPSAVGFGLYGALTVAVVLGIPLLLVVAVSERVDDVDSVGRAHHDDVEQTQSTDATDDTTATPSESPKD